MVAFLLSTILSFSDITLNNLVNAHITLKYLNLNPVCILFQYTSPGIIYHLFSGIPSSRLEMISSSLSCFLSWTFFYLLYICHIFQALHQMWRRSWVSNEHFLKFLVDFILFLHARVSSPKKLVMIYLFSDISLLLLFIFIISLFLPVDLFFVNLLMTVRAFLPILLLAVTFFNYASIIFEVRTGLVLFYFRTIFTLVTIFTTVVAL